MRLALILAVASRGWPNLCEPREMSKNAGKIAQNYYNEMSDWTRDDLLRVSGDSGAPVVQVAVANALLRLASTDTNRSGIPIAGPEMDRMMDRTLGKPMQQLELGADGAAHALGVLTAAHRAALAAYSHENVSKRDDKPRLANDLRVEEPEGMTEDSTPSG